MKFDGPGSTLLRSVGKPPFIYGTAWKKESTTSLVVAALAAGFTAVDTAAQPRHYREDLVGEALRSAYKSGICRRENLFLQTKFTPIGGQDLNNMPYHPDLPLSKQIPASVESSLRNLRVEEDESSSESAYIDCLLLHSPLPSEVETSYAWKVMQSYVPARIRHIGISNVGVKELTDIWRMAGVHPAVVQNKWHEGNQWDREVRAFCREKGIVYESFWTLTGNPGLLKSEPVERLSQEAGVNRQAALYSLVVELGIAPLNGTTNKERMDEDLKGVANVGNWSLVYAEKWESIVGEFKAIVNGP